MIKCRVHCLGWAMLLQMAEKHTESRLQRVVQLLDQYSGYRALLSVVWRDKHVPYALAWPPTERQPVIGMRHGANSSGSSSGISCGGGGGDDGRAVPLALLLSCLSTQRETEILSSGFRMTDSLTCLLA
jgi:hypothetical protein